MWQPKKLETKQNKLNLESSGQKEIEVTELWADGIMLSNGIELNNWDQDPIQFIVCDHCGTVQCSSGNWMSPRSAGEYVLFIPAFMEMSKGSWELDEYQPPFYYDKTGVIFFDQSVYTHLCTLVPNLPQRNLLKSITMNEVAWLLQWEAPFKVLGEFPNPLIFQKKFLLSSNQKSDNEIIIEFQKILSEAVKSTKPVFLQKPLETKEPIEFFFENTEYKDWRPLCRNDNKLKFLLLSEFIVEESQ